MPPEPTPLNYESPSPQPPPPPLLKSCLNRLALFLLTLIAALAFGIASIYFLAHHRP